MNSWIKPRVDWLGSDSICSRSCWIRAPCEFMASSCSCASSAPAGQVAFGNLPAVREGPFTEAEAFMLVCKNELSLVSAKSSSGDELDGFDCAVVSFHWFH